MSSKLHSKSLTNINLNECLILELKILNSNSIPDQEILESIQSEYFNSDEKFDASRFELCSVPIIFNSKDIVNHYKRLIQQHHVVSKKVLLIVLQKQSKCKEEFEKILEVQKDLLDTITVCKISRCNLKLAAHQFTSLSLQILYCCRKRKILKNLLSILYNIKTLYCTKDKLQQLLNEENYPTVISLISDCQTATKIYKRYNCIVTLYNNLNDTLEQVEENLDLSLSKICTNFNVDSYASIQVAYNFLGKSQTAMDQLHMHFTAAINDTAFNSVLKYANIDVEKQYSHVCKSIPLVNFFSCLIDLCKTLLAILKSYYHIIKWHDSCNSKYYVNEENVQEITNPNEQYLLQKLKSGIMKICNDIENKITIYLDGFDLTPLKFEDFMQALSVIDRMSKIGNMVCKRHLTKLYECTKEKFINYFNFYHASRLDELKIFLENDGWELCPIKSTFKITQLLEFKTFKCILNLSKDEKNTFENLLKPENYGNDYWNQECIDDLTASFDIIFDESAEENILRRSEDTRLKVLSEDSDDDEIPEELKYDSVDEVNKENALKQKKKHSGPIVTNATLSVLRICGKYLQVTRIFKEVARTVIQYMVQIFELYFYAVYNFFTADLEISIDFGCMYGTHLRRTISRIKDTLIENCNDDVENTDLCYKVRQPHLSSIIDLSSSRNLFGLTERIVAVESLIFLGLQYESFRLYLNSVIFHNQDKIYLNQFYFQTIASTIALRKPIYMAVISKVFDIPNVLILMSKVDWELKDVISQHNNYVDVLIKEIQEFKSKLTDIQNHVPLSKEVYESIWECVAHLITHTLVEGFSNAKKCSNGGRALMQLDFTQFISNFEAIALIRPMPYQEYVALYIKAYYLPESSIELWIKSHAEYSSKHLIGLISCMYQNKKVKQRLMTLIEDLRLSR